MEQKTVARDQGISIDQSLFHRCDFSDCVSLLTILCTLEAISYFRVDKHSITCPFEMTNYFIGAVDREKSKQSLNPQRRNTALADEYTLIS